MDVLQVTSKKYSLFDSVYLLIKFSLLINVTFSATKFPIEQRYSAEVYFRKVYPAYKLEIFVRFVSVDIYYILLSDF